MITLQRLNQDTSWKITVAQQTLLLDPWLIGTEIDGFSWFNEQWHATAPVPVEDLGSIDCVVISQPFSDHCHEETLKLLSPEVPIAAVSAARKRLENNLEPDRHFHTIPEFKNGFLNVGDLQLAQFRSTSLLDQVHNALLIICPNEENIFYAPHGFSPNAVQAKALKQYPIRLLISTISEYHLPFFLGGTVNLGLNALQKLAQVLNPQFILNTHDEKKHAKGIVSTIARTFYPEQELVLQKQPNFIAVTDYTELNL